jgi:hypothetical protein
MSEPCRHERAASEAIRDALASLAASDAAMEMATAELLAKDATIGRLDEDVAGWISRAVDAEATIERVKAVADSLEQRVKKSLFCMCEPCRRDRDHLAELCAALEPTP